MPDLLEQSQEWLTSMNRIYRSRQVIYARGAQENEIPALVGKTVFKVDKGYGLFERVEARDYLIEVADLAEFGEPRDISATRTRTGRSFAFTPST